MVTRPRRPLSTTPPARRRRPAPDPDHGDDGAAVRKADRVADDLLRRIVGGEIAVGSVLPREDELATRYGAARGVVREAIKLLEVHRLVRPVRRRGTIVLDPLSSLTPEVVAAMLKPRPGVVDVRVLEGVLEVRAALDAQCAELAASRRSRSDLEALRAELAALRRAAGDPAAFERGLARFGTLLARASKNPIFPMLAHWNDSVVTELGHVFRATRAASEPQLDGMDALVGCIESRDAAGARALVGAYHAWAAPRILATARLANGEPVPRSKTELR